MIRQVFPEQRARARALGAWPAGQWTGPRDRAGLGWGADGHLVVARDLLVQRRLRGSRLRRRARDAARESDPTKTRPDYVGFLLGTFALGAATFATIAGETRATCPAAS